MSDSFFSELGRRNVLRAAAFYAASAWLLVQVATQVFPFFSIPNWIVRWIVIAAIIGFPFAMLFAWFYEFTPFGIQRESQVEPSESTRHATGKKLDRWIIAILGVAVVLLLTNTLVPHKDMSAAHAVASDQSIAVLPLANASGDKDEQFFSDGLSENLIIALSQFDGLKVIGRSSAFQFRDSKDDSKTIGSKLGVAHLLEGSVQHAGDAVRISAELINAADGRTLWSQRYDRPYKDLFKLQDEITNAVAAALKTKLLDRVVAATQSDRPPSGNLEAYTAYLQGKFYGARFNEADARKAIAQYAAAIRIDPRYALAYAELSRSWTGVASYYLSGAPARQAYAQARMAADTALALDPKLAVAHNARGYLLLTADFDWAATEVEFRRALQLAPNNGGAKMQFGRILAALGQIEPAITLTRQALATDPVSAGGYATLASNLLALDRLDEAETAIRKSIELQPGASTFYELLATIEIQRGDANAALAAAQQEPPGAWRDMALALAQQIGSDRAAANAALQVMLDKHADLSAFQIAEVYALRKDTNNTFEWLDRAWVNRDPGIVALLVDPFLLRYKDDPRFAAFCRKVGLPTPAEVAAAAHAQQAR